MHLVLTPGLVDSHTHAVFGRWRADEYALRARGVPYMEIARRGGGINASVRDLRERSEAELVALLELLEDTSATLDGLTQRFQRTFAKEDHFKVGVALCHLGSSVLVSSRALNGAAFMTPTPFCFSIGTRSASIVFCSV